MYSTEEERRLKELHTTLYVVKQLGGRSDFHKIFKTLYFADRSHLAEYGVDILGDRYICMEHGPVPSTLYDRFKALHGRKHGVPDMELWSTHFKPTPPHYIEGIGSVEKDLLSESELKCLNAAIAETQQLSFGQLTDLSHDSAWNSTQGNFPMDPIAIATAGGANDDMLRYIELSQENSSSVLKSTKAIPHESGSGIS